MPIHAEFRHLYRHQWLTVIRPRVLKRAYHQCERCRKPLHAWVFTYTWKSRDPQFSGAWRYHMIWIKEGAKVWRNQDGHPCSPLHAQGLPRKIRVKLTIAHADHQPSNMEDLNLRCWCTWCHLHHDQPHHKETRCHRKDAERPMLDLAEQRDQALANSGTEHNLQIVTPSRISFTLEERGGTRHDSD